LKKKQSWSSILPTFVSFVTVSLNPRIVLRDNSRPGEKNLSRTSRPLGKQSDLPLLYILKFVDEKSGDKCDKLTLMASQYRNKQVKLSMAFFPWLITSWKITDSWNPLESNYKTMVLCFLDSVYHSVCHQRFLKLTNSLFFT